MRYIIYLSLILALTSCKKQFEGLTNFTMEFSSQAKVESSVGINLPFNISTPPIETNAEAKFSTENTRTDLVEEIFIESLTIEITSPNSADFSFLENIKISLSADGETDLQVGWKTPVPSSAGATLELDVTPDDLQRFIVKDEFKLKIEVTTDELLAQDHYFDVKSSFKVKAKLLN